MSGNVTQQKQKRYCDINGDLFKEIIQHTYNFHSALTNEVASHSKLKLLNFWQPSTDGVPWTAADNTHALIRYYIIHCMDDLRNFGINYKKKIYNVLLDFNVNRFNTT